MAYDKLDTIVSRDSNGRYTISPDGKRIKANQGHSQEVIDRYELTPQPYQTAEQAGRRKGPPVVLKVDSQRMFEDGIEFLTSENGVWFADEVDPQYFTPM